MIFFWVLGAALAVGVLAFVLRPLLKRETAPPVSRKQTNISIYRDQLRELDADLAAGTLAPEDHERARAELERRLLEDVRQPESGVVRSGGRRLAIVVGAAIPVLAFTLYLLVGSPAAVQGDPNVVAAAQIEAMVGRLAARLRDNPDDTDGWKLLGRSYSVLGRYREAVDAYAKAAVRAPRDAQLLTDFADALAMARGGAGAGNLQGEPEKLVLRALELEPNNLKALALAGTAAFERKDYAGAAAYWERMLPHVAPGSEDARAIQQNVGEARSLAGAKPSAGVRGTVSISRQLRDKAAPDDTVFVFARALDGPPMPLAVARTRVRDLPYRFQLDDSMAMTPAMKLSAFPKVVVAARVSKSGTAAAQPGDLQGMSAPVSNDASAVNVVIDTQVR